MKKALSLLVVLAMVISMVPSVFAAESGPVITEQPVSQAVEEGATVEFKVVAEGDGLTYQWQWWKAAINAWTGTTVEGNKTAAISVEATAARNGYKYRCVITDANGNQVTTNAVTLTIGDAAQAITITSQPKSATADLGATVEFAVVAEGNGLTYQWQWWKAAINDWSNTTASGNKTAAITLEATEARNGYKYRCVITDAAGNKAISDEVTLSISGMASPITITSQPKSATVALGTTVKFAVVAEGTGLTYQWQWWKAAINDWSATTVAGNKTAAIDVEATAARNGYKYRCVITDANGNKAITDAAVLTVSGESDAITITSQPKSATAALGSTVTFAVEAEGTGLTYQWQWWKAATKEWRATTVSGNQTAAIAVEVTEARNGYKYRCVITDAAGNKATTDEVVLTVGGESDAITITSQPESATAPIGETVTFAVEAEGEGLTYQWQWWKEATKEWRATTVSGNQTAAIAVEVTAARDGYKYRCVITDASGNKATTDEVTLTVGGAAEPATIISQPQSITAELGEMVEFTVVAEGTGLTYQWQWWKEAINDWTKTSVSGNQTATITVELTEARDGYMYRCVITDAMGNQVISDTVVLSVNTVGTETNPIYPEYTWNDAQSEATATVTVPAGETLYYGVYAGMELSVNGESKGVLTDRTYAITNEGEEAAEYVLVLSTPLGMEGNPVVIDDMSYYMGSASLEASNGYTSDAYYYSYTAPADGTITLYITEITENVTGNIIVRNSTWDTWNLLEHGVDNYGLELKVDVVEGETYLIWVETIATGMFQYPAADISWAGMFSYPLGTENNPIYPEYIWNDAQTEATVTVTVPAGETLYYGVYAGMELSVNGEAKGVLTADTYVITNEGEEAAEYVLVLSTPLGKEGNPVVIEDMGYYMGSASLEASNGFSSDAYYYSYTAPADGTITLYITEITEGVTGNIIVRNSTWDTWNLLEHGVDNYGLELKVDVVEGETYLIWVETAATGMFQYPAADISWAGMFSYPLGSENNPIYPEYIWNDAQSEATVTVTVPAGETLYYGVFAGMELSVNGEAKGLLTAETYAITNEGEEAAEYELVLTTPLGEEGNPVVIEGNAYTGSASLEASSGFSSDAYYYSFTAPADGTITLSITEITENVTGNIVVRNSTWDTWSVLGEGVEGVLTVDVVAGETYLIWVETQATGMFQYPAAEISWDFDFVEEIVTDTEIENPVAPNPDNGEE